MVCPFLYPFQKHMAESDILNLLSGWKKRIE